MNIKLSQQVSATYARNHFKEVNDKALKEGFCVIMRKSQPVTVVMSMQEYAKLQETPIKKKKKITLEQLRKNSTFAKYRGCLKDIYPGMTSVELAKQWYKNVN